VLEKFLGLDVADGAEALLLVELEKDGGAAEIRAAVRGLAALMDSGSR